MNPPHQPATTPFTLLAPVLRFLRIEAASGVLLLAATVLAILWASSPSSPLYVQLWHTPLLPGVNRHIDLQFLINDGLMTGFFLQVGLEIRRERHEGALASLRVAGLPLLAAVGGVIVPALLYLLCAPQAARGWAIPTATDIAFAAGILALTGRGTPSALRVLLLTLAIADDIAAVLIIALFYAGPLHPWGLLLSGSALLVLAGLQRIGRAGWVSYLLAGLVMWRGLLLAGVHPALTGVLLGLSTPLVSPARGPQGVPRGPACAALNTALHPWVAFLILPLFALANAGVDLRGLSIGSGLPLSVAAGITAGLVLGKPLGILLTSTAALSCGLVTLPAGMRQRHLLVLGSLGGIGFTMSMFVCNLAFTDPTLLATARAAVLGASALTAMLAALIGAFLPGLRAPPG